ncbi:MAG: hypothetical protein GC161_12935 [Planctomycetaceae bacterium]|nr:hypothetical protein [Planctomycetaceae bacterium]
MRVPHIAAVVVALGLVLLVARCAWEGGTSHDGASLQGPAAVPSPAQPPAPDPRESVPLAESPTALVAEPPAPSEGSRRSPVAGPRGRVLDAATEHPIEGLLVRLRSGKQVLAEALTGPDGSFLLPEPERARRTVEVVSDGWRSAPRSYRLDEAESSGAAELVFRAERIVAAPLRGRLVDQSSGEPVPAFLLRVGGPFGEARLSETQADADDDASVPFQLRGPPRRIEEIVTDMDGQFVSEGGFEAGPLELALLDLPASVASRTAPSGFDEEVMEHRHTFDEQTPPEAAELRVGIGPTYRFDVTLPTGMDVGEFYATFPQKLAGLRELHRTVSGDPASGMASLFGSVMKPDVLEPNAPLRQGEPVWARFRHPIRLLPPSAGTQEASILQVRSRDGHWSGSAPVRSLEGIEPELLKITLEPRGALEGTVLDGDGKPVPTAWIQLMASSTASSPIHEVGADPKGGFAFRWLPEGEYELVVLTERYAASRTNVVVESGGTERLDIRLVADVPLGTVSGVLRSRTGQHRSKGAIVTLRALGTNDFFQFKSVRYRKRKGAYTADFVFEGVPHGEYELSIQPLDNLRWESRAMRISSPAEGLEFVAEDDVPTFDLAFRAIDALTGSPIEERWVRLWYGEPGDEVRLTAHWETGIFAKVSEGVPLHWVVRAEGYRVATGNETQMRMDGDLRVIEARLERGWGQTFLVTTREQAPIEGAELLVDGRSAGTTDAKGFVSMNLDAKPQRLEFRYKDWVVVWGNVDPGAEGFGWGPETSVYLGPPQ